MWGAAPRPGRGRGASAPQRTENRKQKTERAASARQNNRCAEKPNFQASKLPNFQLPLHPRHVCDVPKDVAVGHIGRIGPIGRGCRRRTPQKPKRGVRSPPCPYRLPGRTCASRTRTARPSAVCLCESSWFFVSLAVEGLALWACTVIAAQRSVSSPPRAAARASTSGAPPSIQASKHPSCQMPLCISARVW